MSNADIQRLKKSGYKRQEFMRYDKQGFAKLKNRRGLCFFYDPKKSRCKIYKLRPEGCRIYPVIFSEEEGIIVDELCPMESTISKTELERRGKKVMRLLRIMDREATSQNLI